MYLLLVQEYVYYSDQFCWKDSKSHVTTYHVSFEFPNWAWEAVHKLRQRPNFRIGHSHKGLPLWSRKMMFDPSRKSHGNQSSGLCILLGHSTPLGASEPTRAHTHRTKRSFRVRLTSTVNWWCICACMQPTHEIYKWGRVRMKYYRVHIKDSAHNVYIMDFIIHPVEIAYGEMYRCTWWRVHTEKYTGEGEYTKTSVCIHRRVCTGKKVNTKECTYREVYKCTWRKHTQRGKTIWKEICIEGTWEKVNTEIGTYERCMNVRR